MDFSHYRDDAVSLAVDLVNTIELVSGKDALDGVDGLRALFDRHPSFSSGWSRELTEADVEAVRRLRERLRAVFEAGNVEVAANTINAVLADVAATPEISLHGGNAHLHFEANGETVKRLGAATAMGLATVLVEHGIDRFGLCSSSDCVDAYVDGSKNRSRQHCSTTCSTRQHVAAHRRRARTESSPAETT